MKHEFLIENCRHCAMYGGCHFFQSDPKVQKLTTTTANNKPKRTFKPQTQNHLKPASSDKLARKHTHTHAHTHTQTTLAHTHTLTLAQTHSGPIQLKHLKQTCMYVCTVADPGPLMLGVLDRWTPTVNILQAQIA